jgi:hypothetical protein
VVQVFSLELPSERTLYLHTQSQGKDAMNRPVQRQQAISEVTKRTRKCLLVILILAGLTCFTPEVRAQGCIVARSTQQVISPLSSTAKGGELRPENQGGYLAPHQWELVIGYRHQFSERHFVGPTEQIRREQGHSRVMNKINIPTLQLTYQITPRWSVSGSVPILFATRRGESSPYTYAAQGLGDTIMTAQSWIWSPAKPHRGNISVGFGVLFPTGRDNVQNTYDDQSGNHVTKPVDFSIQPGQGGWGIVGQFQAFHIVGQKAVAYIDGSYIATPQNTNNVNSEHLAIYGPGNLYNSIGDEYLAEAGIAYPLSFLKGLVFTFGPRYEGVPVRDLFGKSYGFRRPGFAMSVEPGLIYARGKSMYTIGIAKAIYRTRERSVPDIDNGIHGDAAFADYIWLASYTYRF